MDRGLPAALHASFLINLGALAAALVSIWWLGRSGWAWDVTRVTSYPPIVPCFVVFAFIAVPLIACRLRGRSDSSELAPRLLRPLSMRRVMLRMLALSTTLGLAGVAYKVFPEYHGIFYNPFWQFLKVLAWTVPLAPLYLIWADTRLIEPRDELLEFGLLLTGGRAGVDFALIKRHLLSWTVKAFFLPLMTTYLSEEFNYLSTAFATATAASWSNFDVWFHLAYGIDLLYCVVGYTVTLRLFDSHIRSVEPTTVGWLVALVCYQPFYSVVGTQYLSYEGSVFWGTWLAPWPNVKDAWGFVIIVCVFVYSLSTVAFGLKFSNLTNRGIITQGPYRFSKHPAYLAKNLSWWLISIPFIAAPSIAVGAAHCMLLLLLNGIYLLRARTEERHLSRDPRYVDYALWMNEHGALRWLSRLVPAIRYKAPPA